MPSCYVQLLRPNHPELPTEQLVLRARVQGERAVQVRRRQQNYEQVGDGKVWEKVALKSTDPTAQLQSSHRRMLLE
jgi:hypothetical protein